MPTPELVDKAQKALSLLPRQPRDSEEEYYWRCNVVKAALKAHDGWLAEQGLVVVPKSQIMPVRPAWAGDECE